MMILKENLIDYIFLSREIPLSLAVLKIIKEKYSFQEIMNFSERRFETFLYKLKKNYKISIREIDKKIKSFIDKKNNKTFTQIENNLKLCEENKIKCMSFFDEGFPYILKLLQKPPKLVFLKGEIKKQDLKAVAIIGTRNPTPYGKKMAIDIARRLTELGFTIISGFAKGIDTLAMKSALENGGRAIGVIASGILNIYPKENQYLVENLVMNGALISERFPLKNVTKHALQIRNRITSGFGLGNIFVEGNKYSGTRWQFKFGEAQQKLAFGVEPINNNCEQAFIPNWIIHEKHGARIKTLDDVDFVAEILNEEYTKRLEIIKKPIKKKNQPDLTRYLK